ncbi:DNA recombination protein RmuC [Marinobacterium lacunae]|uniref:DNA recombination protein RmuC n=1 Tax=Marinobacterium lacunae TaxID=1232683 RepID=A0A081FTH3_9GAMM|nr:DNA recombination protein RmuC [Marinobacterium lacunae]KEA61828.1 DNA recombination protein RmuC [Marinobacterium lacunae]
MTNDTLLLLAIALPLSFLSAWGLASLRAQRALNTETARADAAITEAARSQQETSLLRDQFEKARSELSTIAIEKQRLETRLEHIEEQGAEIRSQYMQQRERIEQQAAELQQSRSELAAAVERRDQLNERLAERQQRLQHTEQLLDSLRNEHFELESAHTELRTTLAQKQEHFEAQMRQLEQSRELLKKEFEVLAGEILERKGKAFTELNQTSLSALLNPIHSEMKGFKEKVERIHEQETAQRIQLKTELENLQKLNRDITDQAHKLTTALQGQKKMQGNWGELMLENVLEKSGLRPGDDYQREMSITTEEGRQRPDAVIFLPQQKHLIIDAKTSLMAYTRYVNAEDESERMAALADHTQAVRDRINELADRDYYRLPGLNSPEIVIMFIPIESAYVEALKYDDTLYQRAIERHVLVATPTTLLTSLNIVRQLWRFEDQSKHTAELADRADKFYRKLNAFLTSMLDVGKKLDLARGSYDKALGQLADGRGNLIKQAAEFKDLGVAVQKELPPELVERAQLELDRNSTTLEQP